MAVKRKDATNEPETPREPKAPEENIVEVYKRRRARGEASAILDELGIDTLCDMLADGISEVQICKALGVGNSTLSAWLTVGERSARAREARIAGASVWFQRGHDYLLDESLDVARARELAQHCRKMAQVLKPSEFGENIKISGNPDSPIIVEHALAGLINAISGSTRSLLAEDNPVIEIDREQT